MSTAYVTEYAKLGFVQQAVAMAPSLDSIVAEWDLAIGAISAQGPAISAGTFVIQINVDVACSLAYGANPTAVPTVHRLAANETRFYLVTPGNKLALIANS